MFVVLLTQCQHCCNTECGLAPPTNALLISSLTVQYRMVDLSLCMVRGTSRVMNITDMYVPHCNLNGGLGIWRHRHFFCYLQQSLMPFLWGKDDMYWVRYVTREGTNTDGLNTSIKMLYLAIHVRKKLPKDKWTTYTHIHDSLHVEITTQVANTKQLLPRYHTQKFVSSLFPKEFSSVEDCSKA